QGSKIAIRQIADAEEEIKSVSRPPEPATRVGAKQDVVQSRVRQLSERGNPSDATRFKFVLSSLQPSAKTNKALLDVLLKRPDLAEAVARHFSRYKKLPKSVAGPLIAAVHEEGVYHS